MPKEVVLPMSNPNHVPKYCYHKRTNQAYVRLGADFVHLGVYDTLDIGMIWSKVQ